MNQHTWAIIDPSRRLVADSDWLTGADAWESVLATTDPERIAEAKALNYRAVFGRFDETGPT